VRLLPPLQGGKSFLVLITHGVALGYLILPFQGNEVQAIATIFQWKQTPKD
jgi:hypothetical protein